MKKTKKVFCVLISACLLLSTCIMANAFDGPSEGDWSWAYIVLSRYDSESDEIVNKLIWGREGPANYIEAEDFDGVSYDLESNTLTLDNAKYSEYSLVANEMGDDFKIELAGDSELLQLTVWGYGWGGSLEITGNGSLNLNPEKSDVIPLKIFAECTDAKLVVASTATLTMNKNSEYVDDPFAFISYTQLDSNVFDFKGSVDENVKIYSEEIETLKTTAAYTSTLADSCFVYVKEGTDKKYTITHFTNILDDGEEDHLCIYELVPCDKVECGYLKVLLEDIVGATLDDIPAEYSFSDEYPVSAIDTENVTGGSNCNVVVELATGNEYIVMEKYIWDSETQTGSFACYLAEPVYEIEHNGEPASFVVAVESSPTWSSNDGLPEGYDYVTEGGSGYYYHALFADGDTLVIEGKSGNNIVTPGGPADVSGDGKITVVDAKWTLQAVANSRDLTAEQIASADVNNDGKVTVVDAKWILQAIAGTRVL